jgi:hypothetical protein
MTSARIPTTDAKRVRLPIKETALRSAISKRKEQQMKASPQREKETAGSAFPPFSAESADLMSQVPDVYKKMTDAWLNFAKVAAARESKPEDVSKALVEPLGALYSDMVQVFYKACAVMGLPVSGEKTTMEDASRNWMNLAGRFAPNFGNLDAMNETTRRAIEISEKIRDTYLNLAHDQMEFIQKLIKANLSGEPNQIMNTYSESSKQLFDRWFSFITEQANSGNQFWKSFMPKDKPTSRQAP